MGRRFESYWDHQMKPESKLWKLVKKNTEKDIHWTRIESWAGSGIPDLHGISDGIDVWVELKVTQSNHIRLSPFQHSWHFRHTLHGTERLLCSRPSNRGYSTSFRLFFSILHCRSPSPVSHVWWFRSPRTRQRGRLWWTTFSILHSPLWKQRNQ